MCGITGYIDPIGNIDNTNSVLSMVNTLTHRGPDDSGVWVGDDGRVALGHGRLSILDLSPAGHQPMESGGGRYVVVYNGEIYNHLNIRNTLQAEHEKIEWRGAFRY